MPVPVSIHSPVTNTAGASRNGSATFFQPKLRVNTPSDVYEREADAVADRVAAPEPGALSPVSVLHTFSPSTFQRKCTECEAEERADLGGVIQRANESMPAAELSLFNTLITPRLQFIPAQLRGTRVGPEGLMPGGLGGDRISRLNVVIGPGLTLTELARLLLPLWNNATPFTPPGGTTPVTFPPLTETELAQALLQYNFDYLGFASLSQWRQGLRFPLPVFVETATQTGVLHPLHIRDMASGFDPANAPLLVQAAAAASTGPVRTPEPASTFPGRQAAARTFLAGHPDREILGGRLLVRALTNARETRELVHRLGDDSSRVAFDVSLGFMTAAVNREIEILMAQEDGRDILGIIDMFLTWETFPNLSAQESANLARAQRMLAPLTAGADSAAATPEASPACASGLRPVTIDFVKLHGNTRNIVADAQAVNQIFEPCCVRIVVNSHHTVDQATTESWLGGDTVLRSNNSCGNPSQEERTMRREAQALFGLSGRIKAFYAESFIGINAIGYAFPRHCTTGPLRNHLMMSSAAGINTLAHEIGHILLDARHTRLMDNLMQPSSTGRALTARQCRVIFNAAR